MGRPSRTAGLGAVCQLESPPLRGRAPSVNATIISAAPEELGRQIAKVERLSGGSM